MTATIIAIPAHAQAPGADTAGAKASDSFEVASIKPGDPSDHQVMIRFAPGGRLSTTNVSLAMLMRVAYQIQDFQIVGAPGWVTSDRFNIEAKPAEASNDDPARMTDAERKVFEERYRARIRSLLADRFSLKLHHESKEMPVYALVIAKSGPKLTVSSPPEGKPRHSLFGGRGKLTAEGASLDMLAGLLSNQLGRTVVNETGLKGNYDFKLEWTPDTAQTAGMPPPPPGAEKDAVPVDPSGPSLFTAMQEQLGLKLESTRAPVDVLVIDHVEKPSAN